MAEHELVGRPQWRSHPKLPCPYNCGEDITYSLALRKSAEDGSLASRLQEPQVCPNPDCGKPLPALADRYYVGSEKPLPRA